MSRQPFLSSAVVTLAGLLCGPFAGAEMAPLDDAGMAEVSGRGGIYLSGDISINELGGPLQNNYFGRCNEQDKRCGARLAYQLKEGGGWMVLDEIRGMFAFEGLMLRVRSIDSGFGGDGELSRIQGQSGITLEMDLQLSADRVSYYDDGRGAHLEGFKMGSSDTLGQGRPVNGSGTAILLNYIHTSAGGDFDGDGQDDNTYGIRTDLAVDVYPTRVIRTVDGVKRVEHPLGFAVQTAVYGAVLQNVDIRANLTATPIP